jgi:hypothetical protein
MNVKRLAREKAKALLPRCLATNGTEICQRELGHGNGWNRDKHCQDGISWTDEGAQRLKEKTPTVSK